MGSSHSRNVEKYQTFDELEQAMRKADVESIKLMVGFDFSFSNTMSGRETYTRSLHDLSFNNPYMHVL